MRHSKCRGPRARASSSLAARTDEEIRKQIVRSRMLQTVKPRTGDAYILEGRKLRTSAKGVMDPMWLAQWDDADDKGHRRVGETAIGATTVSTVFLPIDHGFGSDQPRVFETMIFDGMLNESQWCYDTLEAAEFAHQEIVAILSSPLFRCAQFGLTLFFWLFIWSSRVRAKGHRWLVSFFERRIEKRFRALAITEG